MSDLVTVATEPGDLPTADPSAWTRARWQAFALLRPATLGIVGLLFGALIPFNWLTAVPSFCPFKLFTGLPCPGCGLTRSTVALLHGDLWTSVYFHPLGLPMVIAIALVVAVDVWVWWRLRRPDGTSVGSSWLLDRLARTPAPWVAIGALTLVWIVRLPLYVAGAWVF